MGFLFYNFLKITVNCKMKEAKPQSDIPLILQQVILLTLLHRLLISRFCDDFQQ